MGYAGREPKYSQAQKDFDGLVISWTIGTHPDAELVNTMLDAAIETVAGGNDRPVTHLERAIVIGPIARLELIPAEGYEQKGNVSGDSIIEAQMPSQQFKEMGMREGDMLVVTPRKARVFVES